MKIAKYAKAAVSAVAAGAGSLAVALTDWAVPNRPASTIPRDL